MASIILQLFRLDLLKSTNIINRIISTIISSKLVVWIIRNFDVYAVVFTYCLFYYPEIHLPILSIRFRRLHYQYIEELQRHRQPLLDWTIKILYDIPNVEDIPLSAREIVITCETRMESLKRFCLLDLPQGIEKRDHQGITIPTLIQGVNHLTT